MASLFGRSTAGYHAPSSSSTAAAAASPRRPSPPSASLLPDYDAFAAPDDDDDEQGDSDDGLAHHSHHLTHASAHANASTSERDPLARPATTSSASPHFGLGRTPVVPGAYDFEPQQEPNRAPVVPVRSRPDSVYGANPSSPPPLDDDDDDAHRYGRPHGASGAAYGGGVGGMSGWRGIVARLRGHGGAGAGSTGGGEGRESHGLLFSQDESDETDTEHAGSGIRAGPSSSSYPPPSLHTTHMPLPARPPQFAAPPAGPSSSGGGGAGGRIFGGGQGNDGVFANLAAKPDNPNGDDIVGEGPGKDEVLPPYEAAQLDPSPQYWETTVITPGGLYGPVDILVDGLPVGNLFSFAWNLLVSMSFQFVGFILTYILHTTHAAKNGSRAGLGVTLIQLGFYLKQRTDRPDFLDGDLSGDETGLNGALGPSEGDAERWSWWGGGFDDTETGSNAATATLAALGSLPTQVGGALASMLDASDPDAVRAPSATPFPTLQGDGVSDDDMMRMGLAANEWMAFVVVTVGSFLLIGSCLAYWRAWRYARAIRDGQGPGVDQENVVAF